MIYDIFENLELYCKKGEPLYEAIAYARAFDLSKADGIYEVKGRDIYARVLSYETAPAHKRFFEAHKFYLDVQILLEGCERQDVVLAEELEPLEPYDQDKDMVKLKAPHRYASIVMEPGKFAVFYPHDIHRPNCDLDGTSKVRKICMKVRI
jgi:YhcH/YjgK/YiaL family protein